MIATTEEQAPILFGEEGSRAGEGWTWEGKGWQAFVRRTYRSPEEHWCAWARFTADVGERIEAAPRCTAQDAATELEDTLRGIHGALADALAVEGENEDE